MFSQLWRLEIQHQGVDRAGFFWGHSSWLVDGCLLQILVSVHVWVCMCVPTFSYKDMSQTGIGTTLLTSFYLNYLFRGLISNTVTFWDTGVGTSTYEFKGDNSTPNRMKKLRNVQYPFQLFTHKNGSVLVYVPRSHN